MVLGDFDAGGPREPMPIANEVFALEVDLVLPATGQALELDCVKAGIDLTKEALLKSLMERRPARPATWFSQAEMRLEDRIRW